MNVTYKILTASAKLKFAMRHLCRASATYRRECHARVTSTGSNKPRWRGLFSLARRRRRTEYHYVYLMNVYNKVKLKFAMLCNRYVVALNITVMIITHNKGVSLIYWV